MRKFRVIFFLLAILATSCLYGQTPDGSKMWVSLEIASGTAGFRINLPHDGCVAIMANVPGKNQFERIWGPKYMRQGTYGLNLPAGRISNRNGTIELFNIELTPKTAIGSRGNGERQFNLPMGIDVDKVRKELLIADTGNDRVVRLAFDGRFLAQHGGFGLSFGDRSEEREDSLDEPYDVTTGGFSDFYVADQNNDRICIFDSYQSYRGNLYPVKNDRRSRLDRPRGIKLDSENNVWVVDGRADRVYKITTTGDKLFEIGGFGYSSLQLKDPTQIDINQLGEIYIADRGKGRIAIFDRLGSFQSEMRDHLKTPTGVAIDPDGMILVCDDSTDELGLYTPAGVRLAMFDKAHDGTRLRRPSDIAACDNFVFLLDSGNHRVISFERRKTGSTVPWQAGSPVVE